MARKNRKGYSLAELILGAAVVAAFFVRIYASYATTHDADQFTKFVNELSLIQGSARAVFTQSLSYEGYDVSQVQDTLPRSYTSKDGDGNLIANTPFQTQIYFGTMATKGNTFGAFLMSFQIPTQICQRLITGNNSLFDYVGTQDVASAGSTPTLAPVPIAYDDAATRCSGLNNTVGVTIAFTGGDALVGQDAPAAN